jgi:hypothetical protein
VAQALSAPAPPNTIRFHDPSPYADNIDSIADGAQQRLTRIKGPPSCIKVNDAPVRRAARPR